MIPFCEKTGQLGYCIQPALRREEVEAYALRRSSILQDIYQ